MADRLTRCDVAIVGAGPAGLSAAIQLAEHGADTLVLDEKPVAGGQLFKQIHKFFGGERQMAGMRGFEIGKLLLKKCSEVGVRILLNCPVWGLYPDKILAATHRNEPLVVKAKQVVIATGATENALSFPGWTLPGVMGAGAAQTLVNYHRVRPGSRALVLGAGNVGLIVSYQLLQAGIEVLAVVEGLKHVGGYVVHAAKVCRMGVPLYTSHTVLSASGNGRVQHCTIAEVDADFTPVKGTEKSFDVDLVCLSVGLSPAVELCTVAGMKMTHLQELGGWVPLHSAELVTSLDGVYVAGDASGVEEASSAMEEGKLAAVSALAVLGKGSKRQLHAMMTEAQERLAQLRRGPFGGLVAKGKEQVYNGI